MSREGTRQKKYYKQKSNEAIWNMAVVKKKVEISETTINGISFTINRKKRKITINRNENELCSNREIRVTWVEEVIKCLYASK